MAKATLIAIVLCFTATSLLPLEADKKQPDQAALRTQNADNLKQIAAALLAYKDAHAHRLPPPAALDKDGKPLYSWRVLILPYLGEKKLFKQFNLKEQWDSPHNRRLLEKMPTVYAPPGQSKVKDKTKAPVATYYQVFVGNGAGFVGGESLLYPASFPDGLANTIMLAEAARAVPWSKPADLDYELNKPLPQLGAFFPDAFHVAMFNGSVLNFKKDFDPKEMQNVITRAGNELMNFDKHRR